MPQIAPVITLIEYGPDCLEERKDAGCDELLQHLDNELVTWINIDGLGDLSVLRILGNGSIFIPWRSKMCWRRPKDPRSNNTMTIFYHRKDDLPDRQQEGDQW